MVTLGSGDYTYEPVENWAKLPPGWSFKEIGGVGVDSKDNVYVFNRGEHPMIVFNRDGEFLRSWGEGGMFPRAHGVFVAPDETLWLTDDGDRTVRQCTLDGKVLLTLGTSGKPAPYMSGEPFHRCTHTAMAPNGDIYVSDGYGNSRVHKYTPGGKLIMSWGGPGTDPGEFNIVHNITCDADGWVYVADRENHRVQVFDGNGKYETQWNNLFRPCGLFMPPGKCPVCYIGELGPVQPVNRDMPNLGPRVTIVDNTGKRISRLGGLHAGLGPDQFMAPHGLTVDRHGDIYVGEVSWTNWPQSFPDKPRPDNLRSLQKIPPDQMIDAIAAARAALPEDAEVATLAGRAWRPDRQGPSVVAVHDGEVFDISATCPTMRDLCKSADPVTRLRAAPGESLGTIEALLANTPPESRDRSRPWLLAPIRLQAIKAAGVTFAISMLERVIEERARGDLTAAAAIRAEISSLVGDDLTKLKPGSPEAARLKQTLIEQNAWSQYLEVGIGPDAEIFTKAQPMAAVGTWMDAGVHPVSTWNNPEPEVVLVVASTGRIVGATLGNDVNLRDVEGRSALLLSKAKDNNASCAIGPFVRLFDSAFTLDDIRTTTVTLRVEGLDQYVLEGSSSIAKISRDPADLVAQMVNQHHRYPDGAALFLGTMFAPVEDREVAGQGFTHKTGDIVTIAAPKLGALVNRIMPTDQCEPWTFGAGALMRNLAARGLL